MTILACPRCGDDHPLIKCPYVKAVTFGPDGVAIARVEFITPADFPAARGTAASADEPDYPKLGRTA